MLRNVFTLMLFLFLTACGFQMRGVAPMPEVLQRLAIEPNDPYLPFQQEIRQLLKDNGVTIVSSAQKPDAILYIKSDNFVTKDTSIGADGRIREQSYDYQVRFLVTTPDGKVLVPEEVVSKIRLIEYDPDLALAQNMQSQVVRDELRSDVAAQLVRRLSFVKAPAVDEDK